MGTRMRGVGTEGRGCGRHGVWIFGGWVTVGGWVVEKGYNVQGIRKLRQAPLIVNFGCLWQLL